MRRFLFGSLLLFCLMVQAESKFKLGKGQLTVTNVARNAVRIQYAEGTIVDSLPDWLYVKHGEVSQGDVKVTVKNGEVSIKDKAGREVFRATKHQWNNGEATLVINSPQDEYLYGLGQFQDGYSNVRCLSRRLTQVNTQISIPMLLSSKGYGLLWNNYGLTEFNPCDQKVSLVKQDKASGVEVVNVTSTEGGKQEARRKNLYVATIDIDQTGDYALLLDVGQKMARRHHLTIDGQTIINMQNVWLPPTASTIVTLKAGRHVVTAELTEHDQPVLSPIAHAVDYTLFFGTPDEIIATYRELTGKAPLMPSWALGYIHCRERFHSQEEILKTAHRFRQEQLPVSVLVQDWQYWGKYGWNSMRFDEDFYPDPKALQR